MSDNDLVPLPRINDIAREALGLPLYRWPELANKIGPVEVEQYVDQLLVLSARAERMALFLAAYMEWSKPDERRTT